MLVQAMHEYFWSRQAGAGESLSREPAREIYQREAQRREEVAYSAESLPLAAEAPSRRPRGTSRQRLQEAGSPPMAAVPSEEPQGRRYQAVADDSPPRGFSRQSLREAVGPPEDEREEPAAAVGAEDAPKPWYLQGRENEERRGLRVRPLRVANGR